MIYNKFVYLNKNSMRTLKLKNHLSSKEIQKELKAQRDHHKWLYWQIIYSVSINQGKSSEIIAKILGVEKSKVYRTIENYNSNGPKWIEQRKWGGRRESSCYLTLDEEEAMLKTISSKASKGMVLTASDIQSEIESRIGHKVSDDYIWDLFNRHNWKKKAPRPKHPKSDKEKQEEFKKNSRKTWKPPD
jgi:transposase